MCQVEIKDFDHQGRGICQYNNKVVFVENALPTEVVDINIELEKKKFATAKVSKYVKKSVNRVKPVCQLFGNCGGCDIMHINYDEQLKFKQDKIKNIMKRYTNNNFIINDIIPSDSLYYRNKVTFHVINGKIGYYKEKSNDLLSIDKCFLLDKKIDIIYQEIQKKLNLKGVNKIVIRVSKNIDNSMVIFYTEKKLEENLIIDSLQNFVSSIIVAYSNKFKTIYGKNYIVEKILNKKFIISNDSFFQVNTNQTEKLYSKVIEYADIKENETILDLYCGTGTIGIIASDYAKEVIGIELNKEAIKSADENKILNNISNIKFYVGDTGSILKSHNYHVDTVIVDPPRAGLDKLAISEIFKINAKKIVYVSCDPMTLARDLEILSKNYNVVELTPVDMFPSTAHVECVCVLNRR